MPLSEDFVRLMGRLQESVAETSTTISTTQIEFSDTDPQQTISKRLSTKPRPNKAVAATQTDDRYDRALKQLSSEHETVLRMRKQLQLQEEEVKRQQQQIKHLQLQLVNAKAQLRTSSGECTALRDQATNMRVSFGLQREIGANQRVLAIQQREVVTAMRETTASADQLVRQAAAVVGAELSRASQAFALYVLKVTAKREESENLAVKALQTELNVLRNDNQSLFAQADAQLIEGRRIERENTQLREDIRLLKQLHAAYKQSAAAKDSEIMQLSSRLQNIQLSCSAAASSTVSESNAADCAVNIIQSTAEPRKKRADAEVQIDFCKRESDVLQEHISQLQTELQEATTASELAQKAASELQSQLKEMNTQYDDLAAYNQQIVQEKEKATVKRSELLVSQQKIAKYKKEVENLKLQLTECKGALEASNLPQAESQVLALLREQNQKLIIQLQKTHIENGENEVKLRQRVAELVQQIAEKDAELTSKRFQLSEQLALQQQQQNHSEQSSRRSSFSLVFQTPAARGVDTGAQTLPASPTSYGTQFLQFLQWLLVKLTENPFKTIYYVQDKVAVLEQHLNVIQERVCDIVKQKQTAFDEVAKLNQQNRALSLELEECREPLIIEQIGRPKWFARTQSRSVALNNQSEIIELQQFIKELVRNLEIKTKEVEQLSGCDLAQENAELRKQLAEREETVERLAGIVGSVRREACGVDSVSVFKLLQLLK